MPSLYIESQYVEGKISQYQERYVPLYLTTSASTRQLTTLDPSLVLISGSTSGYTIVLPNATTLENGYNLLIHSVATTVVVIQTFGGALYLNLNAGSRLCLFLLDNTTTAGLWARAVMSSSPFTGTSPVLASYNGNAGVGRYLEVYPGQGSDTASFYVPTNAYIVAFEFSAIGATTATLGVFKTTNLTTPIYTISLAAATTSFGTNLTVPLAVGDQLAFRITAGSATKPRMAMYFTGY